LGNTLTVVMKHYAHVLERLKNTLKWFVE